ncbi:MULTISPECIES: PAS domain-containing sensor histidine kinase [unclassified Minwuia]|uniref:sensor histidine kinase NtrY-like n=1 Tax=unclassified Minwuia TaxID=2618799 RepID=UPI002479ACA2|nr:MULTISPECIES: PAS domain-containing sensor histidine kinase [unclassified Minwuia]
MIRLRNRMLDMEVGRLGAFGLAALALGAGAATYATLFRTEAPLQSVAELPPLLIIFDVLVLVLLVVVIVARVWRIWRAQRAGMAGAALHMRLASLFAAAAVVPALLVAGFSTLFFDLRLEGWFSERAQQAVAESVAVAESLITEHRATIRADALAMAQDLNRVAGSVQDNRNLLNRVVSAQAGARGLSEAIVFDRSGTILAQTSLSSTGLADQVPLSAIEEADRGDVVMLSDTSNALSPNTLTGLPDDKSAALILLDGYLGVYQVYLYVGRFVEPRVAAQVQRARQAAEDYERLAAQRFGFELTFFLMFVVVTVLLMLAAVWLALTFSTRISRRLGGVVVAAERVREGDLAARVVNTGEDDEIETLGRTFNRMARQIENQQAELQLANRTVDERRRFMETVLAGVTAGVIGLDTRGFIDVPNRSASRLLGLSQSDLVGRHLDEAVPEMADLLRDATDRPNRLAEGEISISREGTSKTFFVRVGAERRNSEVLGYVVTFDDITDLVSAQRMAVWADVARRIAHEIRNPLTPIQLSAERLKRKYLKQITTDPEIFIQCTDTIVRQVGDIGRMIEEFSAFARMPAPVFRPEDLADLIRQSAFAAEVANPDIDYQLELEALESPLICDRRQVAQVLTNVLKNASEAISGRENGTEAGRIRVTLKCHNDVAVIAVTDNGIGLPETARDRLTEPYVTTRDKGTGLGLAIVRKIMEEHSGVLQIGDAPDGPGAEVRLCFPLRHPAPESDAGEQDLRVLATDGHTDRR